MKKIVVLIFVVMAALSAKAQFYAGGNVALWHNDDADNTSFLIEPEFGYGRYGSDQIQSCGGAFLSGK